MTSTTKQMRPNGKGGTTANSVWYGILEFNVISETVANSDIIGSRWQVN